MGVHAKPDLGFEVTDKGTDTEAGYLFCMQTILCRKDSS